MLVRPVESSVASENTGLFSGGGASSCTREPAAKIGASRSSDEEREVAKRDVILRGMFCFFAWFPAWAHFGQQLLNDTKRVLSERLRADMYASADPSTPGDVVMTRAASGALREHRLPYPHLVDEHAVHQLVDSLEGRTPRAIRSHFVAGCWVLAQRTRHQAASLQRWPSLQPIAKVRSDMRRCQLLLTAMLCVFIAAFAMPPPPGGTHCTHPEACFAINAFSVVYLVLCALLAVLDTSSLPPQRSGLNVRLGSLALPASRPAQRR